MSQSKLITLGSLSYIRPQDLASQLSSPPSSSSSSSSPSSIAIIDVRDDDYLGGHIKNSIHTPINQLDARMPELLRTLKSKDRVVFHCMLSQQRGPKAALAYARARAGMVEKERKAKAQVKEQNKGGGEMEDGLEKGETEKQEKEDRFGGQEICVLEGGFGQWQSRYGEDANMTEGYVKELWESVFS